MDRRYDRSSQGDGSEGFKVKNNNNFRVCKQVENSQKVRDNVVSQGKASNYVNKYSCKKYCLVLIRVEI